MTERKRRKPNPPWKGVLGTDRRYTARVNRAIERGQYTEPGTLSNPPKPSKKKRAA